MSGNENGIDFTDYVSYRGCRSMYQPISRLNVDQHIGHSMSVELWLKYRLSGVFLLESISRQID